MTLTCRRAVLATMVLLPGVVCTGASIAQANPGASASVATAASVTVGQAGVPGSITLTNTNTPPDQGTTNIVCSAGAGAPCRAANERGIELVPACAIQDELECATGNADPGAFRISSTARGQTGSACDGMTFSVAVSDPATGAVRFTPPAGEAVTVPDGLPCVIEYTLSALRLPNMDAQPLEPGVQTRQVVGHRQITASAGADGAGASIVTVLPATASLSTAASPSVAVGAAVTDTATVTGLVNPAAGGTFTFRLFGPASGASCSGSPLFTNTVPAQLSGTTATATSGAFTTTTPGTHRWVASYDGDARNLPISGACGDAGESVEVTGAGGGGGGDLTGTPPFPAKLEVSRAFVDRAARRLSVLAPITARASGRVTVRLRAAGRTTTFTAAVDSANARVRFSRRIPAAQANLGTGILTITYGGDADTQPQEVRLRAASRRAQLEAGRPTISAGGVLTAGGRISSRARGVVRVQLLFEPAGQGTRTIELTAPIAGGRYRLSRALPPDVLAQIATRRGAVHSYTLFTGFAPASMRGETASFQVLAAP